VNFFNYVKSLPLQLDFHLGEEKEVGASAALSGQPSPNSGLMETQQWKHIHQQ
jgi:hypothetical protein